MADVRLNLNLGRDAFIIHDTDPLPDRFNSCDPERGGGDTVEVRQVGSAPQHFSEYAAYNQIVRLGAQQMRTLDYDQLRQISFHLDSARAALNSPAPLTAVDRELSAAQNLLAPNHINSSRGAIAREISLIRRTVLQQECLVLMQSFASGSVSDTSARIALRALDAEVAAHYTGAADRYVRDTHRVFELFTQRENPANGVVDRDAALTELTQLIEQYQLPDSRLNQIPSQNNVNRGDGC